MPASTSLTFRRVFWHSLRIYIYAKLCVKARKFLAQSSIGQLIKNSKLIILFALLVGSIIYQLIQKLFDKFLKLFYPIHELNPFDEFFLYDNDSPANAALLMRCEKFSYEKHQAFLRNVHCEKLPKQKVKLIQMLGRFYWLEMSNKEFDSKFDNYVPNIDSVHSMEEMQLYCSEVINSDFDLYNNVPWRFYIFNNVSEDYTYMLATAHHSFTDAIQFLSAARAISNNKPEFKGVPGVAPWKQALGYFISPLYAIKRGIVQIFLPFDRNCFMNKDTPKERKRCIILGEDCNRTLFHQSCKHFKCSFGEASHALLGKSINGYMSALKVEQVPSITFGTTFSLKPYAKTPEESQIGNYFVPMLLSLRTSPDFAKNLQASREQARSLVGSMELLGQQTLCQLLLMMPYNLSQLVFDLINSKRTMTFSSVPAPKDGFNFDGVQTRGFYGILPFLGDTTWGLTFCSCDDSVLTALICDRHYMEQPELFMEIFNQNLREFIEQGSNQGFKSQKTVNIEVIDDDNMHLLKISKLSKL